MEKNQPPAPSETSQDGVKEGEGEEWEEEEWPDEGWEEDLWQGSHIDEHGNVGS